jgi:hypothetical protein
MFVGKARSLAKSGTPERCYTCIGSGLTPKHKTRLESHAWDKHSSLLGHLSCEEKKVVVNMDLGATFTTLFYISYK